MSFTFDLHLTLASEYHVCSDIDHDLEPIIIKLVDFKLDHQLHQLGKFGGNIYCIMDYGR
jgi:hypothetical protein